MTSRTRSTAHSIDVESAAFWHSGTGECLVAATDREAARPEWRSARFPALHDLRFSSDLTAGFEQGAGHVVGAVTELKRAPSEARAVR